VKSIPAFSKKSSTGATVGGGGKRSGFTDHVKCTYPATPKSVPHMAATYPTKSTLSKTSGSSPIKHPAFKSHSGAAGKSVPAFSKKKI
jgi:hypothetical protein